MEWPDDQKIQAFSNNHMNDATANNQPPDENCAIYEGVDKLKDAIDHSAVINGRLLVVYLLSMIYFLVTAGTTTDLQLLIPESRVILPILNVGIDLYKFCIIAPLVVVVIHFNFLYSLFKHSEKLRMWKTKCGHIKDYHFSPFLLNSLITTETRENEDGAPKKPRKFWLKMAIGIVVYLFPLSILWIIQFRYADYHDMALTLYHFLILLLDFALLSIFWRGIVDMEFKRSKFDWPKPTPKILSWVKMPFLFIKRVLLYFNERAGVIGIIFLVSIVIFGSYVVSMLTIIKYFPGPETYRWAKTTIWYIPHLKITDNQFLSSGLNPQYSTGEPGKRADSVEPPPDRLSRGINLSGRDLRLANFSGSNLRNADLSNTHLQGSNMAGTLLQGVNLENTQLQWSNFLNAQLDDKSLLFETKLQEASLERAVLDGANLLGTNLNGANLTDARMSKTVLRNCKLNGAVMAGAKLNGAKLFNVELIGADLNHAELRNAELERVQLQGSDLSSANLNNATFRETYMDAVNLNGAILESAYIERTRLNWSNLTGADLNGATILSSSVQDCLIVNTNLSKISLDEVGIQGSLFKSTYPLTQKGKKINKAHVAGVTILLSLPKDRARINNKKFEQILEDAKVTIYFILPKIEKDRLRWLSIASSPNPTLDEIRAFAESINVMPVPFNRKSRIISGDEEQTEEEMLLLAIAKNLGIKGKDANRVIKKKEAGNIPLKEPLKTIERIAQISKNNREFEIKYFEQEKPAVEIYMEEFKRKEKFIIKRNDLACEGRYIAKGLFLQLLHEKGSAATGALRQMIGYMKENCPDIGQKALPDLIN